MFYFDLSFSYIIFAEDKPYLVMAAGQARRSGFRFALSVHVLPCRRFRRGVASRYVRILFAALSCEDSCRRSRRGGYGGLPPSRGVEAALLWPRAGMRFCVFCIKV